MTTLHELLENIEGAKFDENQPFGNIALDLFRSDPIELGTICAKVSAHRQHVKDQKIIKALCEAIRKLEQQRDTWVVHRSVDYEKIIASYDKDVVAIIEKALKEV